jgi:transcriptional regulator with XRE-family HTH domain
LTAKTKPIHTLEYRRMLAGLRAARDEAGLTQAEVAAHFERPQSFVSKCESGERRIDPTELRMFAQLYRKPVSYFLDEGAESAKECSGRSSAPLLSSRGDS